MPNYRQMSLDPVTMMGMGMMARNKQDPFSAFGESGLATQRELQRIETASANRTWRQKQSAIQEERNKIAQEMNQKRMEMDARKQTETERKNEASEKMYTGSPKPVKEGDNTVGYTYGGRFSQKPKLNPMDALMYQMMGGGMGMPGGVGFDPVGQQPDPYSATRDQFNVPGARKPAAPPAPPAKAPSAPPPSMPITPTEAVGVPMLGPGPGTRGMMKQGYDTMKQIPWWLQNRGPKSNAY